ncbi:MAG: T9SS type A sorting domain-containing protein, partial [bacterium]
TIWTSDSFTFEKLSSGLCSVIDNWDNWGEDFPELLPALETSLPAEYVLKPNYPNPFNAETIIALTLPQVSHVQIELFNVRAQSVGKIFQGDHSAGELRVLFNAAHLPSGVYFCKVRASALGGAEEFQDVSKMLLLK